MSLRIGICLLLACGIISCGGGSHTQGKSNSVSEKASYKPRMGDRYFISEVLLSIFRSPANDQPSDPDVTSAVNLLVLAQPQYFDGPCKMHDANSCLAGVIAGGDPATVGRDTDISARMLASSSPPREGQRINACRGLTEIDGAISVALARAGLTTASAYSDQSLRKVYQLFYPTKIPSSDALSSLKALYTKGKAEYSNLDAWRLVLYTVCISPGWQIP